MITIAINEKTSQAKAFLRFIETLSFVQIINDKHIPNTETRKAIDDARKGRVTKTKNVEDLIKKLNE